MGDHRLDPGPYDRISDRNNSASHIGSLDLEPCLSARHQIVARECRRQFHANVQSAIRSVLRTASYDRR